MLLVDGNSLVPLSKLGPAVSAAAHLRPRIHKQFVEAWRNRASAEPELPRPAKGNLAAPFTLWDTTQDIRQFVRSLPIDQSVAPITNREGGTIAGRAAFQEFVAQKLRRYGEERSQPDDPLARIIPLLSRRRPWVPPTRSVRHIALFNMGHQR